ncbi:MAG: metallophosphoesterase [Bacilli bacterium]|nr:metallophosphoesterase [Bacilli bacterium]
MTREELNKDISDEIEEEELKEKRKKIVKKVLKIILIVFSICIAFIIYTKIISTSGLKVNEKRLEISNIPESFNGVKIIQFSDLQYGSTIFEDELNSLVEKINKRNPDIVVFTGDLIDKSYKIKHEEIERIIKSLSKINSNIGKYAVNGDEDKDNFNTILTQSGFTVLDNSYELVYNGENTPILITGISSNNKDIDKTFSYFKEEKSNKDIYNILIMHEPDTIDKVLENYKVDLALSGGNLNGEIYIPKIGGLFTRKDAKKYTKSYYEINNTKLYVSSGVGTDELGIRLGTFPSINFLRLAKVN